MKSDGIASYGNSLLDEAPVSSARGGFGLASSRVIERSSLFTRWTEPSTGVESFLLARRAAPVQMSFYFTNPSFTTDGRYLWFYCLFPPGGQNSYGHQLAVVDLQVDEVRLYPEAMFMDASPYVDPETGAVYWTTGLEVWRRGPLADDRAELVGSFPGELAKNRRPRRIATHLTRSADGRSLSIDAEFSPEWFVGDLPIDGSGPARIWQRFERCYNHAQFSPTDPDLMLIAQDGWHDSATGRHGDTVDRLWLIRRGEEARPLCPDAPSNLRGHEWWDAGGDFVWYIDYRKGTERVNIHTGERANIWPGGHTHSQCDRSGRYLVGDVYSGLDEWRLAFFNIATGKEAAIVSKFPVFDSNQAGTSLSARTAYYNRAHYHVHPHPQFCLNDEYIAYTTNVRGSIDQALAPVAALVELTG